MRLKDGKMLKVVAFVILLVVMAITFMTRRVYGAEMKVQRVTCYYQNSGHTASGTVPKQGRTVAGRKEDIGKVAALYRVAEDKDGDGKEDVGEFIGFFNIEDTGSHPRLKTGSIDVYRETLDGCWDWIHEYGDYLYVQVIEGEPSDTKMYTDGSNKYTSNYTRRNGK